MASIKSANMINISVDISIYRQKCKLFVNTAPYLIFFGTVTLDLLCLALAEEVAIGHFLLPLCFLCGIGIGVGRGVGRCECVGLDVGRGDGRGVG